MNIAKINKHVFFIDLKIEELRDNLPIEMIEECRLLEQITNTFTKLKKELSEVK